MTQLKRTLSVDEKKELANLLELLIEGKNRLVDHFTHWCIKGPSLGASAGITAMLQEEMGHVAILSNLMKKEELASGLTPVTLPTMKNIPDSWHELIAEMFVFDTFFAKCLQSFVHSSFAPLRESIPKMIHEERFHHQYSEEWALLLLNSNNFSSLFNQALQKALDDLDILGLSLPSSALIQADIVNEDVVNLIDEHRQDLLQIIHATLQKEEKGA
jgi:1,2-phenylacetyl-CoA epoxidase catalytic subunit